VRNKGIGGSLKKKNKYVATIESSQDVAKLRRSLLREAEWKRLCEESMVIL
jgi:hypothetical protein